MYEQFGAVEIGDTGVVEFKLFLPDHELAPAQYTEGGGLPRITEIRVVGDFQSHMGSSNWTPSEATRMDKSQFQDADGSVKGWLYSLRTPALPEGFYEYKYHVAFENDDRRQIGDPCSRYGGRANQNSGFVVGGRDIESVLQHRSRTPYKDLIIYELMIDDFTAEFRGERAPLAVLQEKLDYLVDLGINAIEFMPWTAWPSDDFGWGYNPFQFFSVAHRYTLDPLTPSDKIFYLKELIGLCHERDINVIMDGVFNHVDSNPPEGGFAYGCLYQDPFDSPYIGIYATHDFFADLDYANQCTLELMRDVCFYWMDVFKIDGIRLDNTLGFYAADDPTHGLPRLLGEIWAHTAQTGSNDFSLTLEHSWDYGAIDVTNRVGATSCWYDMFRSLTREYLYSRRIDSRIMRMLNTSKDFGPRNVATIYIENHDHSRIMDAAGGRHAWWRTQPYAIALFTCPGAVLIYNGQEFGENYWMPEPGDWNSMDRVRPRPLRWQQSNDEPGRQLRALYKRLIQLRKDHAGLRSPNFYPTDWYDEWQGIGPDGFGVDVARQVVVYHRWGEAEGGGLERFYVVLNFSDSPQYVEVPFAENGTWEDLLSGWRPDVQDHRLRFEVGSNWGHIFYRKS